MNLQRIGIRVATYSSPYSLITKLWSLVAEVLAIMDISILSIVKLLDLCWSPSVVMEIEKGGGGGEWARRRRRRREFSGRRKPVDAKVP